MDTKKSNEAKQADIAAKMARVVELRGNLMALDVTRAEIKLTAATADRQIAQEYGKGEKCDTDVILQRRVTIAECTERLATVDLEAAKLMVEHDKLRIEFQGV